MKSETNESSTNLYQHAQDAAARGDIDTVLKALFEVTRLDPHHREANANLAWLLSQQGDYRRALSFYLRLLRINPFSIQAHLRSAQCFWFLIRRQIHKWAERHRWFEALRRFGNHILWTLSLLIVRILEIAKRREPVVSRFMRAQREADTFARINPFEYYKVAEIDFVMSCLKKHKNALILDLGSGRSSFPTFLAKQGAIVVTAELDQTALSTQRRLARSFPDRTLFTAAGDFLNLPFQDETFDAITIISSIEHVPDQGDIETVKRLGRLLRSGGDLIITVPAGPHASEQWTRDSIGHVYQEAQTQENAEGFLRVYKPQTLHQRLIEPSGLKLKRLAFFGETTQWGWLGLGRNFITHKKHLQPSPFAAPLCLAFCRELSVDELDTGHWAVGCVCLGKGE